jgi:hypothetical protein
MHLKAGRSARLQVVGSKKRVESALGWLWSNNRTSLEIFVTANICVSNNIQAISGFFEFQAHAIWTSDAVRR